MTGFFGIFLIFLTNKYKVEIFITYLLTLQQLLKKTNQREIFIPMCVIALQRNPCEKNSMSAADMISA